MSLLLKSSEENDVLLLRNQFKRRQRAIIESGFSLIEIMVGMVIGMLGIIAMMQVASLSEAQRRSTVGGGDALNSGAIVLYGLQREVDQAGLGISDSSLVGCDVQLPTGVTLATMAPVTINHPSITGQDANTDTLLIVYGNGNGTPQGDVINSQPATIAVPVAANSPDIYNVSTSAGFCPNGVSPTVLSNDCQNNPASPIPPPDRVIAVSANLQNIPRPTCAAASRLVMTQVVWSDRNSSNVIVTSGQGQVGMSGGRLFNMGRAPSIIAYAIRSGRLTRCDYLVNNCGSASNNTRTDVWIPVANDIVSLRAEYGRDTLTPVNATTGPVNAVLDTFDQTQPATNCAWTRVTSVRMALVARGGYDKSAPTYIVPVWAGSTVNSSTPPLNPTAFPINLSAVTDWRNYRYKVFETVIPIRNMVWNGVPPQC